MGDAEPRWPLWEDRPPRPGVRHPGEGTRATSRDLELGRRRRRLGDASPDPAGDRGRGSLAGGPGGGGRVLRSPGYGDKGRPAAGTPQRKARVGRLLEPPKRLCGWHPRRPDRRTRRRENGPGEGGSAERNQPSPRDHEERLVREESQVEVVR